MTTNNQGVSIADCYCWFCKRADTCQARIDRRGRKPNLNTHALVEQTKAFILKGNSLTRAAKLAGVNVGLAYYHLKKEGFEIAKREARIDKKDKRELNIDRAREAQYYLDTCQLHALPLRHGHDTKACGVSLIALVEKPNRIVGLKAILGSPTALECSRFIRECQGLPKGSIVLSDVGNEFCGEFAQSCKALSLVLVRQRGWQNNRQNKPYVEGVFGDFQKNTFRPVLGEYLCSCQVSSRKSPCTQSPHTLSLEAIFSEICYLLTDWQSNKEPKAVEVLSPIVIAK